MDSFGHGGGGGGGGHGGGGRGGGGHGHGGRGRGWYGGGGGGWGWGYGGWWPYNDYYDPLSVLVLPFRPASELTVADLEATLPSEDDGDDDPYSDYGLTH